MSIVMQTWKTQSVSFATSEVKMGKGVTIPDSFVNVTQMCLANKVCFDDWIHLDTTNKYLLETALDVEDTEEKARNITMQMTKGLFKNDFKNDSVHLMFALSSIAKISKAKKAREKVKIKKGYIYLASNSQGNIKIGFSKNLKSRLESLKCADPSIKIVQSFTGTMSVEKKLHKLFDQYRIAGEWFSDEVLTLCTKQVVRDFYKKETFEDVKLANLYPLLFCWVNGEYWCQIQIAKKIAEWIDTQIKNDNHLSFTDWLLKSYAFSTNTEMFTKYETDPFCLKYFPLKMPQELKDLMSKYQEDLLKCQ